MLMFRVEMFGWGPMGEIKDSGDRFATGKGSAMGRRGAQQAAKLKGPLRKEVGCYHEKARWLLSRHGGQASEICREEEYLKNIWICCRGQCGVRP